jgi:hypothetical protein
VSTRLFGRRWQVIIDTLDISALHIQFHISKSIKAEPNKCELKLFNLSPDHIAEITKRAKTHKDTAGNKIEGVRLEISAGYTDEMPLIFRGDIRDIATVRSGPDRVTTITGDDGGRGYRTGRISESFGPGASIATVLRKCAEAMGVGTGNIDDFTKRAEIVGLGSAFPYGTVLSGQASKELDRMVRALGLTWSIQNGVIQVQEHGKPLQTSALSLSSSSGLIDTPTVEIDTSVAQPAPDAKAPKKPKPVKPQSILKLKTLMIPGVYPGRKIVLDADVYKGGYALVQCDYVGDTAGNDWSIESKARVY